MEWIQYEELSEDILLTGANSQLETVDGEQLNIGQPVHEYSSDIGFVIFEFLLNFKNKCMRLIDVC